MTEQLSPERAVRLLRAKAGEMENKVLHLTPLAFNDSYAGELRDIIADIALVMGLLADHIDKTERTLEHFAIEVAARIAAVEERPHREWGAGG